MALTRLVAFVAGVLFGVHAAALDLQKLVQESQRVSQTGGEITLVWWMPHAFWQASMETNPQLTPQMRDHALAVLDDYTIFALMRGRLGGAATLEARPKSELVANARLEVAGEAVAPLAPDALTPEAQAFLVSLKPMLANLIGKMGQGLQIVVYPGKRDGQPLLDETRRGSFRYVLFDQSFIWRLPLGSALPTRVDAKTGQEFPGDFLFNPYTGEALERK